MASIIIFHGPGGIDPAAHIRLLRGKAEPTVGDALYAGQVLRTRIIDRTARGVDSEGVQFTPYSEKHPYTLYPNRGGTPKSRSASAGRIARITGGKKTPYGVRYASYGAAKRAAGRTGVDLFGLENHTHMLNTILVKAGPDTLERNDSAPPADSATGPAEVLRIGFYGDEAGRAAGNNDGVPGRLPRRHFFDASEADRMLLIEGVGRRIDQRLASL